MFIMSSIISYKWNLIKLSGSSRLLNHCDMLTTVSNYRFIIPNFIDYSFIFNVQNKILCNN